MVGGYKGRISKMVDIRSVPLLLSLLPSLQLPPILQQLVPVKMNRMACILSVVAFTITLALSKSIPATDAEHEPFSVHNSVDYDPEEVAVENALVRYLLTKELIARARPPLQDRFEMDERQKKRGYWKQCAFNAVSCFGK